MDKMREEFEVFCKKHNYRTDKSKLGGYVYHVTSSCWDAWQASRQALVVELPATCCRTFVFEIEGSSEVGMEHDEYYEVDDILSALSEAGIKWTE